jgi:hypothetical protein
MPKMWLFLDNNFQNYKIALCYPEWTKYCDFLLSLGLKKEQIIFISNNTKFRKVLIPETSFYFNEKGLCEKTSIQFVKIFEKVRQNTPDKFNYEKIYLTRRKKETNEHRNSIVLGEEMFEKIFEKNGFKVIQPDNLSIEEQISLIKNCKILAGCSGSGLHQSIYMPNNSKVICLFRDYNRCGIIQTDIDKLKGHTTNYIDACISPLPSEFNLFWNSTIIGPNKFFIFFLNDNNFIYEQNDLKINRNDFIDYFIDLGINISERSLFLPYKRKNTSFRCVIKFLCCFIPIRNLRKNIRRRFL